MRANFPRCLAHVLQSEGLWSDHPDDPGGATMKGITIRVYADYRGRRVTKDELRAIPDKDVEAIYRLNYWTPLRGDALPSGVDYVVFDFGVNSGVKRAAMALQRAIGVADDGKIGNVTLRELANVPTKTIIGRVQADRLKFLRQLSTFPTFGKGWTRRVSEVTNAAMSLA